MNSKPHRTNSTFQLKHFLVGDCCTPDGAWNLMYGQKIDIEVKISHSDVQRLRRESKIAAAQEILNNSDSTRAQKLDAEADILEQNAGLHVWELNLQAAKMELADIEEIMEQLEPYRKYSHLPLLEATEAAQEEEWLLTLKTRAENHMIATGGIPPDELRFMRNHPQFEAELVPHIQRLSSNMKGVSTIQQGLLMLSKPLYQSLPTLAHSKDDKVDNLK